MFLIDFDLKKFRPILEYADVVWDSQNQNLIAKLESIQLDAARIVTGGTKLTSINNLYVETRWEKLSERRRNHRLTHYHKILNNKTPEYLRDLLPDSVGSRHDHNTRQRNNISQVNTRTRLYSEYFIPATTKLWDTLNLNIRKCESLSLFKKQISTQNSKIPAYYYIGHRFGQILHARLRMDSSSLNSHLFLRNLVDSPNCRCGDVETNSHFLLSCPLYTNLRQELLDSVSVLPVQVNTKTLLFGSTVLSDEQNSLLFSLVQKYIIKSKRFNP